MKATAHAWNWLAPALCVALALANTSCVVGRTASSLGHVLDNHRAESLLDDLTLPGPEFHRASILNRCEVYRQKLEGIGCASMAGVYFTAVGGMPELRAALHDQLVERGWRLHYDGPAHYPHRPALSYERDNYKQTLVVALGSDEIIRSARALRDAKELVAALDRATGQGLTVAGVTVRFRTPSDVIKSRACFIGDCEI